MVRQTGARSLLKSSRPPENGFYIISVPEWAAICLAAAFTNADAQDFQLDLLMPDDEPVQMDLMTIKAQA